MRIAQTRWPEQRDDTLNAEDVQALDLLALPQRDVRVKEPETDSSPSTLRLAVRGGSWQALSSVLRQSARERETPKGQQIGRRDASVVR
jgi:hypothetical protein